MEKRDLQSDVLFYALGAVGLGLTGLIFGDLARPWQLVPLWVPLRTPLTYLSLALILVWGAAALTSRWRLGGIAALGIIFSIWALLLKTPVAMSAPAVLGAWLGFAEAASLAITGLMAASSMSGVGGPRALVGLRIGYGLCAIVFGLCHYIYVDITASMVPEWLSERHFWAYLTGTGHLAAGFALLSGVLARLAARMLGLMMGSFVLLVHLPDTIAQPTTPTAWTIQFIALALAGGAWLVGGVLARQGTEAPLPNLWSALGETVVPKRYGS
jgi:uncharacterized membrane protein